MGLYYLGEVIKRTRESLGITQEALCEGICSPETLSRIETGKSVPNRANFQALMERMGKCGERYFPFIHSDDIQLMMEWSRINELLVKRQYKEVNAVLIEFERKIDMDDSVNHQFVKRVKAICAYYLEQIDIIEMRSMLVEALRCTVLDYEANISLNKVYSRCEIRIICNIAVTFMLEGNLNRAIELMRQAEQYFYLTKMDQRERSISEALLISNLTQCMGRCGKAKEAIEMGERGIQMCLEAGDGSNLSDFLYNVGFEMEVIKADEKACKERMIQAYCIAELNGNSNQMRHIEKHWKNKYNDDLCF